MKFGPWTTVCRSDDPFWHVIIDDFLDPRDANILLEEFPAISDQWIRYDNPIEKKFALDNPRGIFDEYFALIKTDAFLETLRTMSGIPDFFFDETMRGAGLHYHPEGGKLDVHLDYSIHPTTGRERRLNLILYLNAVEEGGDLELWNADRPVAKIPPRFNRAVAFETGDASWHGMPTPIARGERRSVAAYYVSEPRPGATTRHRAFFRPLPGREISEGLRALYDIRSRRTITPEDLLTLNT